MTLIWSSLPLWSTSPRVQTRDGSLGDKPSFVKAGNSTPVLMTSGYDCAQPAITRGSTPTSTTRGNASLASNLSTRPRLRPRQQALCSGLMGTRGGRPAVHTLAWVLGGAVLLGWERSAPAGALGGNINVMALVQHPAGLGVTSVGFPCSWKANSGNRAVGTVNGPNEGGGTRLWGGSKKSARRKLEMSSSSSSSSGQGFSSSSEGINKERSAEKAANKRPLARQRGVKAADAEAESSAVPEATEQVNGNDSMDCPREEKGAKGGALRTVRMRKFLPPKRRHKRGNRRDKEALNEGSLEGEDKGGVVQLSEAAAAREIVKAAAESSPPWGGNEKDKENGAGSEEESSTTERSIAGDQGHSKPRSRKCPPAVGFVNGFKDSRLGEGAACSSGDEGVDIGGGKAGDGKTGPPGVEALIRALSDPFKPGAAPQRWHSGATGSANSLPIPAVNYQSEGVSEADRKTSSPRQKTTKPQPDASQLYSNAIGARIDEQSRIDPPSKSVSISFDPEADTPLSCITLNTDVFGEALHSHSVGNMSRADVASHLEKWVLVSVKHGVAPRELQALFQETQGNGAGEVSGRGDIDGQRGGVGRWAYHGSRDRGRRSDEDASGGSWTRYGWKRLNPPPEEVGTAESEDCSSSSSSSSCEGPTESEEEEMMENVAEALVGGGGGRLGLVGEEWSIPSMETRESSDVDSVFDPSGTDPPYLSCLERPGAAAGASHEVEGEGEEPSLLGLRVLQAVEARFKSGLHPPRIIAIGDVHGCLEELKDLVRKVEYWPGDLLLFLGDLVAKGPDSAGVVQLARELGGVTVRGNHEFEVLRWLNVAVQGDGRAPSPHHKIALSLSEEDGNWLKASPWFFRCDDLGSLFVHAGFASGVSMNKQNPRMMMNMRSVSPSGLITSKVLEASPWARHWRGPHTVFFGHDAERGLQLMDHAVGIDTGCVYGGRLTACILPERRLVSVASKAAYIAFGKRRGSKLSSPRKSVNSNNGNDMTRNSYRRHRPASPSNKPR